MTNNSKMFDPRFGKRAAYFVGRDDVLRDLRAALADPEEQYRVTILSGIKGSGKSSILSEVRTNPGTSDIVFAEFKGEEFMAVAPVAPLGSATSFEPGSGSAKVFLIDDVSASMPGFKGFITDFSRRVHNGEDIKLILAGLPHDIDELLKDDRLSYLRIARRISLGYLRTDEVLTLFVEAFDEEGKEPVEETVLRRAAEATAGYPYMIQLVGYYLSKEEKNPDDKAVDKAIFLAKIELYKNIHEPVIWSLSSKDRMFLWAMAQDEGSSEFGEIARRMNVSAGYASKYRERLINAGVIYRSAYGELAFTFPFMKEYVEKEFIELFGGEGGKRRL